MVTYRDALGQETVTSYDGLGRPISTAFPDGTTESTQYDANSNPILLTQATGTQWSQSFDPLNQLESRTITKAAGVAGPSVETYDFDPLGRLQGIVRGGVGTQIDYDRLSRPVAETTLGRTITTGYDLSGNRDEVGYPSSLQLAQSYTPMAQLDTITSGSTTLADLDWNGQLRRAKQVGATTTAWRYDQAERWIGHQTTTASATLVDETLRLDDRGLRIGTIRDDLGGQGWSWALDGAGRLTAADRVLYDESGEPIESSQPVTSSLPLSIDFTIDKAQNLTERRASGLCGEVSVRAMPSDGSGRNRPGSIGSESLEWDANGNLTRRGDQTFVYDDRDRLVEVRDYSDNSLFSSYTYDAFNRRVRRTVGGRTFETVWDGWRAIEEIEILSDGGEVLQSRRVYGTGIDEVLRLELLQGNELKAYTPIYDATTSLVALADDTGRIVERYDYTPYGERIIRTDLTPPAVEQVRLEDGKLIVEMSEVIASGGFDSAQLENLTQGTTVPVEWDRPIVEGRRALHRLVIEPQASDPQNPTIEAGDQLRWTLPALAIVDTFGNQASGDYRSPTFAWNAAASQVIDDTTPPQLLEACVVDKKIRLGFSEPLDVATLSELGVAGVTSWQPTADGYGVESTTALDVGTATLTIGAITDLYGQSMVGGTPATLSIDVEQAPTNAYQAPFAGESTMSAVGNTLGFLGLSLDAETGFYYVRNRYYDPSMGRFTQPDPLGYVDGPSMYAFAMNSPVSYSDPLGLYLGETDVDKIQAKQDAVLAAVAEESRQFRIQDLRRQVGLLQFQIALQKDLLVYGADDLSRRHEASRILRGMGFGQEATTSILTSIFGMAGTSESGASRVASYVAADIGGAGEVSEATLDLILALGPASGGVVSLADDSLLRLRSVWRPQRGMPVLLKSSSRFLGVEPASQDLVESIASRRTVRIAAEGSEDLRYLDYIGAEANVGGPRMDHILLRKDPSKAAVLEEFLHGTQQRLGLIERLGLGGSERHVKAFMIRHRNLLGLSEEDVKILQALMDAGL